MGSVRLFYILERWLLCPPRLHLFHQKYSNIVKYRINQFSQEHLTDHYFYTVVYYIIIKWSQKKIFFVWKLLVHTNSTIVSVSYSTVYSTFKINTQYCHTLSIERLHRQTKKVSLSPLRNQLIPVTHSWFMSKHSK